MKLVGLEALHDFTWLGEEAQSRGKDEAVVVDVGGGLGQLLKDVITTVPGVQASQCVLQDREDVIAQAVKVGDEVLGDVVKVGHDFHGEQSVKGEFLFSFLSVGWEDVCADKCRGVGLLFEEDSVGLSG